jgi:flagellar basal-body rod modification protein FlgD
MPTITNDTSALPNFDPTSVRGPSYRTGVAVQQGGGTDTLGSEDMFLKLLVAQLKNQNPENPTDGTQFVAQLAQFTQLEQSLAMRQDLDAIKTSLGKPPASPAPVNPAP